MFDKIVHKYGIGFIDKLQANGVQGMRGTWTPHDAVDTDQHPVSRLIGPVQGICPRKD